MFFGQFVFNYHDSAGNIVSTRRQTDNWIFPPVEGELVQHDKDEFVYDSNLIPYSKGESWKKLGIQGPAGLPFKINNEDFILGPAGIYEINDTEINIFEISTTQAKNIIIDYGCEEARN